MADRFIRNGDFCEVVTDKFAVEHGVKRGRLVYVAGHRAFPLSENDPYTQRIKFMVHLLEDDKVKPMLGLFFMDPDSIQKVDEGKQKALTDKMRKDFDDAEGVVNTTAN